MGILAWQKERFPLVSSQSTQPRHDLVSRVDQQLGAELGIACDKNPFLGEQKSPGIKWLKAAG